MTSLNVIARNPGHYGDKHRRTGEAFALAARADFAANWMEAVGWGPKAPATEPPAEKPVAPADPKPAKATKTPATET